MKVSQLSLTNIGDRVRVNTGTGEVTDLLVGINVVGEHTILKNMQSDIVNSDRVYVSEVELVFPQFQLTVWGYTEIEILK